MKKFYFLRRLSCTALLAAALPLAGGAAVGDMFTADGLSFQDLGNNEAALVKPADSDYSGQITVPATVDNGGTTYNVTTIGDGSNIVFKSGVSMVTLPEGITTLKSNAFGNNFAQYYDGEKTVALPSTLTTLESRCFNMTQITKLEIPDGVTEIPATCFPDNMNLVEVTFGSNVTTIGNNVFQNAWSLTALHIKTVTPPAVSGTIFPMYASYCSVYVPTGSKAAYEEAWASQGFKEYIEEGGVMPPDPEPVGPQVGDTIQVDDGTGRMMKYEITGIDEQPTLELLNNGYRPFEQELRQERGSSIGTESAFEDKANSMRLEQQKPIPPIKGIAADINAVLLKCLQADPEKRFENCTELRDAVSVLRLKYSKVTSIQHNRRFGT